MTLASPSNQTAWPFALRLAGLWLVFVAWSACAGWGLSALQQLNGTGYLCALPVLVLGCAAVWKASGGITAARPFTLSRFRKNPLLILWLIVATAGLVGGIAYAPSNYDALSYRLPRILYWLQENRWHWLEHADSRMNYSGTGFEWQMVPLMIFQSGDRLLFLLNWIPYLLFPALCFQALVNFGVSKTSAARWMWIIPLGYGFALQASSIGNDQIGGILVVASISFAGMAEKNHSRTALILSAIAASALTAQKLSNLPLLLPIAWFWIRAAWSMRQTILGWSLIPGITAGVLSSFIPLAALNHFHCGNWAGDPEDSFKLRVTKTIPGLTGNAYYAFMGMADPPILPVPKSTLRKLTAPLEGEDSFASYVRSGFPRFRASTFGEIPTEEGAGLGLGISILLLIHLIQRRRPTPNHMPWIAITTTLIASAAYMAKMGSENTARLMLPYAPLCIAAFLAFFARRPPSAPIAKAIHVSFAFLCIMPGLVLNPNRPLVPLTALAEITALPQSLRTRILALHEAYASRNDPLFLLRRSLPENIKEMGFAGGPTQSSYSLFKPFGSRRVVEVHRGNVNSFDWLAACPSGIRERTGLPWDEWLASSPYSIVSRHPVTFTVQHGSEDWFILHANPTPPPTKE